MVKIKNNLKNYKLWLKAKKIIPGGNMLFSKRPELLLPKYWPTYFKKSKGCFVWDLDGNKYTDFSLMGVGTNILGYSNRLINLKVKKVVEQGNMSTLNCYEEVKLTELLLKIHPWADMVKYARSGGEANSIAIRIARASSKKKAVAVCGYHGWHDWYLAANFKNNSEMNNFLITGLKSEGVPKSLKDSIFTFKYNDFESLKKLLNKNKNIGIIKMEVSRNLEPKENFLKKIRHICNKKKIILIFDECTSGFRETFGGLHKKYNVNPDIAIFGKALGNGYAITSVLGKKKIMKNASKTFISSTFWTERIGFVAAIETLKVMKKEKSWSKISNTGDYIKKGWKKIFKKYNYKVHISGLRSIPNFAFESKNLERSTYFTQSMLSKNYLAGNILFVSTSHTKNLVKKYLINFEKTIAELNKIEKKGSIKEKLLGPVKASGFKRLN